MNIIVLGAGAIGSFYGAKLSKSNNVTLIARQKHADKINKYGLKITGLENKTYEMKAAAKISKIENNSLILLTTKVYDSEKAIKSVKNLVKNDTIILCLQNGLYTENIVKKIIRGKCLVLRAITNFGAAFLKPGIVQYNNNSYTAIEKSPRSKAIADNFRNCGLNGYVSKSIKHDMWKKLVLNCVFNPLSAILRAENRFIADEKLNPLKRLIVGECLKAAKKDNVVFSIDFVKTLNDALKNSRNISSMQQDLIKGKNTEIGYLNGAVADFGRKHGVRCPVNEALAWIVKEIERKI